MLTDDQITALAREYAEEMIKGKPTEELPNCRTALKTLCLQ